MSRTQFPIHLRVNEPALILAPMEGVTDPPMRQLLGLRGGFTFCVAEFLRISQNVPPAYIFEQHMPELLTHAATPCGVPVQLQLLGGDPEKLAHAAALAVSCGATAVDLNFGCPARTVNRNDGGASLLKHPTRIRAIVAEVRRALPPDVPLSAKLRLGWDDPAAIHVNAAMAIEGGAAWITIHGRTRMQGYTPPAYWEPIGEVRRRAGVPVVANGEIWTLADFERCRDITGCEHFMIGRGALADPTLPARIAAALGLRAAQAPPQHDPLFWPTLLEEFAPLAQAFSQRPLYLVGRLKQWLRMSHQRFPNVYYDAIKRLRTADEIYACMKNTTAHPAP